MKDKEEIKMTEMEIRQELYNKLNKEYDEYIDKVKDSADDFIKNAYQVVMKEEILSLFDPTFEKYDIEQIKALNNVDAPLDHLYVKWLKYDDGLYEEIDENVCDTLFDIAEEQRKEQQKIDNQKSKQKNSTSRER